MLERTTYAIGDIHGRLDLLESALAAIAEHGAGRQARLVFLGDYIDRGPESRGVIERLMALPAETTTCLMGNHELLLLRALAGDPADARRWLRAGGGPTLESYGAASVEEAAATIPLEHRRWLESLPTILEDEHRTYVHAGVWPGEPAHAAPDDVRLWVREPFLQADPALFDRHVVHGHTPMWAGKPEVAEPELHPHRTNLDTGAFATGVLAIGVFRDLQPGGPEEVLLATEDRSDRLFGLDGAAGWLRRLSDVGSWLKRRLPSSG